MTVRKKYFTFTIRNNKCNMYRVTQKWEILKNATKIKEIQEKIY